MNHPQFVGDSIAMRYSPEFREQAVRLLLEQQVFTLQWVGGLFDGSGGYC